MPLPLAEDVASMEAEAMLANSDFTSKKAIPSLMASSIPTPFPYNKELMKIVNKMFDREMEKKDVVEVGALKLRIHFY